MDWNDGWNYRVRPVISYNFVPVTSDGAALGTSALPWSDLFLASGSVINWNAGDMTLTHSANFLQMAGGSIQIFSANDAATPVVRVSNTADTASMVVLSLEGGKTTAANDDEAFADLKLRDSAGNRDAYGRISWRAVDVTSTGEDGEMYMSVVEAGALVEALRLGPNYAELNERTAPAAPAANKVRIFCRDNGAGKTQLCALFPTGAVQQIAIEP
jgi:hypothetical protein